MMGAAKHLEDCMKKVYEQLFRVKVGADRAGIELRALPPIQIYDPGGEDVGEACR
jgi:hypothetical protein